MEAGLWNQVSRVGRLSALAALLTLAGTAAGQQTPSRDLPDAPLPKHDQQEVAPKQSGRFKSTLEILGRRSAFFPELAFQRRSLHSAEKLELAVDESIAPSRLLGSAFTAGIGQARNSLPGYGQEWNGYGKRLGASVASSTSSHLFGTFLLASALRQDPRYFVKLHGSTGSRVIYALERVVVTRTDSGGEAVNWSGILGSLMAEGLANSYLPDAERTTGKTFSRFGIRIGFSMASNVVKEYWPTIFKSLRITRLVPSEGSDPGTVTPPPDKPRNPQF